MPKKAPTHKGNQKRPPENRKNRTGFYDTARWRRLRRWQLNKEPLCRICEEQSIIEEATVVDHIEPHKGDYEKFFNSDNLQSLCTSCHNTKTAKQDGGFGK